MPRLVFLATRCKRPCRHAASAMSMSQSRSSDKDSGPLDSRKSEPWRNMTPCFAAILRRARPA
eukprot:11155577-Lingulodinium_polyedra.AAC.1